MPLLFGDFALDPERRQLLRAGTPVPLEGKVYELLTLLAARRPRVLSKAQIRDVLWPGIAVGETSLPRVVAELRQALGDDARQPRFIRTAHGFGYAFCGEASDGDSQAARAPEEEPESPYPGLLSFTEGDADRFFGREAEVVALWDALRRRRLLAVIGASGAGKTSFVRAGVAASRPEGWAAIVSTPGPSPLRALGQALGPQLASDPEALRKLVAFEDADHAFELLSRWRHAHHDALLVVDAFEELFTLNPPEVQSRFAALLGRLVTEAHLAVLLSLRDDFLLRCHEHEALRPVFGELTPLGPPTREGLRRAITEPARRLGYGFEDEDLVDEMVESVEGGRGALPLLAFGVSRLWDQRDRERKLLTRRACDEIGGVAGALAQHAEATLERIGPDDEGIVREVFRNLTTAQGTRGVLEAEELLSAFPERDRAEAVLAQLLDARLLTSYEADGGEAGPGRPRVEVVHESLLTAWPRLVRWQTQDADGGQLRDQLRQAARLWHERGRPEDLLWTGASLLDYRAWRARYRGGLSALEADFAGNMTALAGRRRRRRRIAVAAALAASLAVATGALGLWRRSEHALEQAQAEVRSREAAQILSLGRLRLEDQPSAALAYALASLERADTPAGRRFAVEALWRGPTETIFGRPEGAVSVAFSPGGRFLAYSNDQGTRLQPRDGSPGRLLAPDLQAPSVAFSRDGERLLLRARTSGPTRALAVPDGRELAPAHEDGNAALPQHPVVATIGPDGHLVRLSS
ncbi:MAG TPA: winged helix-turn-helix domain-containing protein, partial [Vicinamibacteria bacterium]